MAKGIIVVDVPDVCMLCFALTEEEECLAMDASSVGIDPCMGKPDWCPIRPVPEKKNVTPLSKESYVAGWNECIDEILSSKERS